MSEEAKYSELLKELGSILYDKNRHLIWLEFKVSDLEKKLEEAEEQIKKATEG